MLNLFLKKKKCGIRMIEMAGSNFRVAIKCIPGVHIPVAHSHFDSFPVLRPNSHFCKVTVGYQKKTQYTAYIEDTHDSYNKYAKITFQTPYFKKMFDIVTQKQI